MAKAATQTGSQIVKHFSSKILEAGMFLKANSALVGPSEGIPLRFPDRRNDHEVELVMVIGKTGSDIPQSKALDYVAGYCLGLDMTVRGREDRSSASRSMAMRCSAHGWSPPTKSPTRIMCRSA